MLLSKNIKKVLNVLAVTGLIISVGTASALTISPARAEVTGDPGEMLTESFLIINDQDSEQTYYTSVENFDSQGESGTPNFIASKEGLPSWIKVEEKVTLKKGERVKVPYTINIPTDADAGGHFAAIFLSTVPPSLVDGQVSVGAKVGMLVLLKVTGDVKEGGGLLSFTIKEGKKVLSSLPLDFVYRFSNSGNDRVKPEGEIVIRNTFGIETARINANTAQGNILPGSVRRFEVRYGENKAPEPSAPFFDHVSYQMNNFSLGMYTATLNLKFGNTGMAESKIVYFMFPWQLLSIVLGIVLITFIVLVALIKKYNRWIIKQARGGK